MNCDETRHLLPAHLDGELDVVRDAEIVAHLDGCPACADRALAHAARRGLVQEKLPRFTAPAGLEAQIRTSLHAAARPKTTMFPPMLWNRLLPLAAALLVTGGLGFRWGMVRARDEAALQNFVSAYVRSAVTGHAIDVVSTDRHTVKPWFGGKLDFTPAVPDLAAEGFPLVGGRIDRIGSRPAAVLVYQRRKHVIDLFVLDASAGAVPATTSRDGFNVEAWTHDGQQCVAISDLAAPELADFARLWRAAADK
ncbi:MAG TPA: anti-sigma factor [Lacunisphaera sp.]|nr:anti-sigma factor [Lacunisphaera sp.]